MVAIAVLCVVAVHPRRDYAAQLRCLVISIGAFGYALAAPFLAAVARSRAMRSSSDGFTGGTAGLDHRVRHAPRDGYAWMDRPVAMPQPWAAGQWFRFMRAARLRDEQHSDPCGRAAPAVSPATDSLSGGNGDGAVAANCFWREAVARKGAGHGAARFKKSIC